MKRVALVFLFGCAHPRGPVPVPLPAPFTCGLLAQAEGCDPLWGCVQIREDVGSCYGTTSAILTLHLDEPKFDPEDVPPDGGVAISSFEVQMSSREVCGTHPLEAVKCVVDRADACAGEVVVSCRVWKDRQDEAEIPRTEKLTLRVNES